MLSGRSFDLPDLIVQRNVNLIFHIKVSNGIIVCYSIYNWSVPCRVKKTSSKMFEVSIAASESF